MKRVSLALACLLALLTANIAHAERNSRQRVAAFAKLPDWTGVWERFNVGPSGGPGTPEEMGRFVAAFGELRPPYNSDWREKYQLALRHHAELGQAPATVCSPLGFPQAMLFPAEMMQIIVTPEEATFMFYTGGARHIATDGHRHPSGQELWRNRWGDSTGHWEQQVLIVDTVASNAPIITPDEFPAPLSEQVHVIERIRNIDRDTLENRMTIDDPLAFSHPWSLTVLYHRVFGMSHLIDHECTEADRNPVIDGKFTIAPP